MPHLRLGLVGPDRCEARGVALPFPLARQIEATNGGESRTSVWTFFSERVLLVFEDSRGGAYRWRSCCDRWLKTATSLAPRPPSVIHLIVNKLLSLSLSLSLSAGSRQAAQDSHLCRCVTRLQIDIAYYHNNDPIRVAHFPRHPSPPRPLRPLVDPRDLLPRSALPPPWSILEQKLGRAQFRHPARWRRARVWRS